MSIGGVIFLIIIALLVVPEVIIITIMVIVFVIAIFLEFVLRLFGKSFDDPPSNKIKKRMKRTKNKRKRNLIIFIGPSLSVFT